MIVTPTGTHTEGSAKVPKGRMTPEGPIAKAPKGADVPQRGHKKPRRGYAALSILSEGGHLLSAVPHYGEAEMHRLAILGNKGIEFLHVPCGPEQSLGLFGAVGDGTVEDTELGALLVGHLDTQTVLGVLLLHDQLMAKDLSGGLVAEENEQPVLVLHQLLLPEGRLGALVSEVDENPDLVTFADEDLGGTRLGTWDVPDLSVEVFDTLTDRLNDNLHCSVPSG
jgi:hypothetical protein